MTTDGEILRRMNDLERSVTARLADQEAQLSALRGQTVPSDGVRLLAFRAIRKSKRVPASLRRRRREYVRKRRIVAERPHVTAAEAGRREAIVEAALDATAPDATSSGGRA